MHELGPRLIVNSTIEKLLQTPENDSPSSGTKSPSTNTGSSGNEAIPSSNIAGPVTPKALSSTSRANSSDVGPSTRTPVMTNNQVRKKII